MTAPVDADDIVSAAVTYLVGFSDVLAAVSTFDVGGLLMPGVFQYRPFAPIEGSSGTAVIVESDGGWAGANIYNTMRFPRLLINVWADPIRDQGLNGVDPGEVRRRADQTFWVLDSHLHRPQGGTQMWGQLRTVDCARLTEPVAYAVPDGDGLVRLQAYYAVSQG